MLLALMPRKHAGSFAEKSSCWTCDFESRQGDRTTTTRDYENRNTLVELPSGGRQTSSYDPDGLRVLKADSTGTTKFLWDGQAYLLETDESNIIVAVYTQEPST